ncbi:unnamed protein product, partial [Brassica napus]
LNPTLCRESDGSLPRRVSASYPAGCSKPRLSSEVMTHSATKPRLASTRGGHPRLGLPTLLDS